MNHITSQFNLPNSLTESTYPSYEIRPFRARYRSTLSPWTFLHPPFERREYPGSYPALRTKLSKHSSFVHPWSGQTSGRYVALNRRREELWGWGNAMRIPWMPGVQSSGPSHVSKSIRSETLAVSGGGRMGWRYQHSSLATSFRVIGSKRESSKALTPVSHRREKWD